MKENMNKIARTAAAVVLTLAAGACNDINRQESPVALVVTNTQILHQLDLAGDAPGSTNCQKSIATVHMTSIPLQGRILPGITIPGASGADLNQIKIDRYRVSYVRVDGGHLIPAPFVRSISTIIGVGSTADATSFVAFDPNATIQAPFAALLAGGRDPETGRSVITMDVILEVFGATLAGERVSGSTRMTLDFCFSCGGCA